MSKKPIDVCSFCCNWRREHENSSPATIADSYPEMITVVLKEKFGIGKKAAEEFIEDACYGNWDRMHLTGAEKHLDAKAWSKMLLNEIWYCSDRWSWDRLIRIQWLYQCLLDAIIKDIADKLVWSYYLCDGCKHCNVQVGCLLGKDVHGWKVARVDQNPLDVCKHYEPREEE